MEDIFVTEYLKQLERLRETLAGESTFLDVVFNAAAESAEKLEKYYSLLMQWNEATDLIAPASLQDVVQAHFIDSVAGLAVSLSYLNEIPSGLYDVGSGAGFPGLVWGIVVPDMRVRLVEPRKKRTDFLNRVASSVGAKNIEVLAQRIEDVPEDLDNDFDFSICRALGMEDDYLAEAKRLLCTGGLIAAMVGPSWSANAKHVDDPIERIDYHLCKNGPERAVVFW